MLCPLPVIRTQERVENLPAGDTLRVRCTDHGAIYDIPAWCRVHGHEVLGIEDRDREIFILVRVGDTA
jgi:tRNA 2-thiouridine synthesizing protein A